MKYYQSLAVSETQIYRQMCAYNYPVSISLNEAVLVSFGAKNFELDKLDVILTSLVEDVDQEIVHMMARCFHEVAPKLILDQFYTRT